MYAPPIIPASFEVPVRLQGPGFHLRMLSIDDLEKDFEAVMESAQRLKGLFGPESLWPDGLTLKEDLIDLGWHQREFTLRRSFAYTVVTDDNERCLGCAYIFPSSKQGFEVAVFYWVRSGANADERDAMLGQLLRDWLAREWPFRRIAFPGRDLSWEQWTGLPPVGT